MSSPSLQLAEAPPSRFFKAIEQLTRLGALAAAITYVCGFVIVSSVNARYGVVVPSLFKPKIFSAGLLFMIWLVVPSLWAFRVYSILGLTKMFGISIPASPENQKYASCSVALALLPSVYYLSRVTYPLFVAGLGEPIYTGWLGFFVSGALPVTAILLAKPEKRFNEKPKAYVFFYGLIALDFAIMSFHERTTLLGFWVMIWFYVVGLGSVAIAKHLRKAGAWRAIEWEIFSLSVIPLLLYFFSTTIYPSIGPQYGGGSSFRVVVFLQHPLPGTHETAHNGELIDQSDDGIYLLEGRVGGKCIFIPKNEVSAIRFLPAKE